VTENLGFVRAQRTTRLNGRFRTAQRAYRWLRGSPARWLTATFLLALTIRLVVVLANYRDVAYGSSDFNLFGWEMGWTARSIFLGQGFSSPYQQLTGPTALVPPLYPYLLAGIFRLFGLYTAKAAFVTLGLNSLFSSLTCLPVYFFTRDTLDCRVARIASLAWAIYPFAIYFSAGRVWDYALTSLLFCCCLLVAQKLPVRGPWAWGGFGVLYGVAALSNPSICSMLPFLLLIAMFKVGRVGGRWFTRALLASLAFFAVCAPWAIRSERIMHAHFFLRDGYWAEFYAGNNGDTFNSNAEWAHPASNPAEMKRYAAEGEIAYMAEKHVLATEWVSHHKLFFAQLCVRRAVRFWAGFWSFSPAYLAKEPFDIPNTPFSIFLTFFMIRGLWRWGREDLVATLPFLLAVLIFPIPYYLSHSSADYRQPIEPVIVLLVCVGLFGTSSQPESNLEQEPSELAIA
jgi:4-amino-4-deoxy-L-arabinose transferase-like glycosyltransferase